MLEQRRDVEEAVIHSGDDGLGVSWPRLALWFNYPFSTLTSFMEETRFRLFGHVLVLGPLAFAIIWRRESIKEQR